eukprot:1809151-Pleurochrysis_carterae.AAC.3
MVWTLLPWPKDGSCTALDFLLVRLDKVKQSTIGVHESKFLTCTEKERSTHYCKGPLWSPLNAGKYSKPVPTCCELISHVPTLEELQWNHYGAKSRSCVHEKGMKNRNSSNVRLDLPLESFWAGMVNKTIETETQLEKPLSCHGCLKAMLLAEDAGLNVYARKSSIAVFLQTIVLHRRLIQTDAGRE